MELDDNTERTFCYIINVNQISDKQPNVGLVKQELLESHDVLLKQEVHANKSKTLPKKEKLQFPGPNTLEAEIISNWSLELKSETPDLDCDVDSGTSAFIKQELLHEELDIKSEDETIQETCLDDKYKLGNKLSNPITISMVVKPFKCGSCDYSSERKCNLQRHLNTHTGEKPFQCQICDTRFTQKGHLKTHLRNHTRRKPFKCNICDYRCSQNSTLKIHLRIHTGEKPFKCNVCDYCCVRSGDLKSHLISHTGKKHFKCHICDYSCAQKSNLKIHLRTHTGEKPFKCKICDYCCAHISSLKRHLKTHTEM